eukprot:2315804-Prymnesium_polylepis.1
MLSSRPTSVIACGRERRWPGAWGAEPSGQTTQRLRQLVESRMAGPRIVVLGSSHMEKSGGAPPPRASACSASA